MSGNTVWLNVLESRKDPERRRGRERGEERRGLRREYRHGRALLSYLKEKTHTLCWFGGLSPSSDFNEDIFQAAAAMSNVIFWLQTSTFQVGGFSRPRSP